MPVTPILIAGAGILAAGTQIAAGRATSTEAKYNAKIKEQQAGMITAQQGLEAYQYDRSIGKASSTLTARVAKSGITMSGSPMAALIDMTSQMEMDKAVGQYNYEYQKRFALSQADAYKRQAKQAMFAGYTNAFTTILSTGANYGMSQMKYPSINTSAGATRAGGI